MLYEVEIRDCGSTYLFNVTAENKSEAEDKALEDYTDMRLKNKLGWPYNPFALSVTETGE